MLEADFSTGLHGFASFENNVFKVGLVDGEYQYAGKMAGCASYAALLPQIEENLVDDFVFEAEARWEPQNTGDSGWGLTFGFVPDQQEIRLELNWDHTIGIAHWSANRWYAALPMSVAPSMRPAAEFNKVRLEVVRGHARVFMNDQFVGQAKLPKYTPGMCRIMLLPKSGQPNVRFRRICFWRIRDPN